MIITRIKSRRRALITPGRLWEAGMQPLNCWPAWTAGVFHLAATVCSPRPAKVKFRTPRWRHGILHMSTFQSATFRRECCSYNFRAVTSAVYALPHGRTGGVLIIRHACLMLLNKTELFLPLHKCTHYSCTPTPPRYKRTWTSESAFPRHSYICCIMCTQKMQD